MTMMPILGRASDGCHTPQHCAGLSSAKKRDGHFLSQGETAPIGAGASVPAVGTDILAVPNQLQSDRRVRNDVLG
jgi:hypothetical protein